MRQRLEELVRACRDGEDDAVAELIRRFQAWAVDLAKALLGDEDLARDAVQEAFIAALERLNVLRDPNAFPGWFRQIVRTQAGRITRKRREMLVPEMKESGGEAVSPRAILEREETRERVRAALRKLPSPDGRTAELYYLEERSCLEIARLLQIPAGTVKRRLHDARRRLRSMLLGYIDGESPCTRKEKDHPVEKGHTLPL